VDVTGAHEALVFDPGQDMDWERVSPDERHVVFNSRHGGGTTNLWIADLPPSGRPRQLTFDSQSLGFACWSPDSKAVAAELKRGEASQAVIVPIQGGPPLEITSGETLSWPYSFSPDGTQVAVAGLHDGFWNVLAVPRRGGTPRALTSEHRLNSYLRYPAWSPKGDAIVFERAETTGNVWMLEDAR